MSMETHADFEGCRGILEESGKNLEGRRLWLEGLFIVICSIYNVYICSNILISKYLCKRTPPFLSTSVRPNSRIHANMTLLFNEGERERPKECVYTPLKCVNS